MREVLGGIKRSCDGIFGSRFRRLAVEEEAGIGFGGFESEFSEGV